MIVLGISTSLINHYTNSLFAKILDRLMMLIAIIFNLNFIPDIEYDAYKQVCYALLIISIKLYFLSKLFKKKNCMCYYILP
jgi:hypothetical protein